MLERHPLNKSASKRSVLITGCSTGIGLAAAQILSARGWNVVASVRTAEDAERLQRLNIKSVLLNIADPASIQTALDETLTLTGGRLDALVNNAGIAIPGAVEDLEREVLQRQFDTNFFGVMDLTRSVLPLMRRQGHGRVVMISSILGRVAMPWRGAYNASKFALEGITDTLRQELRGSGIEVSLICPGPVKSRFRDNSLSNFDDYVDSANSAHRETYVRLRAQTGVQKDNTPFTVPPEAVVKRIEHALDSRRPKPRYYVTMPAYVLAFLRCVLPVRWLDSLVVRI
jgi:NAD(P)-dependent dehydrogenase (short-subunit alcohol dehydrogenase family)